MTRSAHCTCSEHRTLHVLCCSLCFLLNFLCIFLSNGGDRGPRVRVITAAAVRLWCLLVTRWPPLCDESTAWRVDRVTSWPGDELTVWRVDWQPLFIALSSNACTNHESTKLKNCWTFGTAFNRVQLLVQLMESTVLTSLLQIHKKRHSSTQYVHH